MATLLDLDTGALEVVAAALPPASAVRLAACHTSLRAALLADADAPLHRAVVTRVWGAADGAGRPLLPDGTRAGSFHAAARAHAGAVGGCGREGAAVVRAVHALRTALEGAGAPEAAARLRGGGASEEELADARQDGSSPAILAYMAVCNGATPEPHPGLLSAAVGAGEVYDTSVAMCLPSIHAVGGIAIVALCDHALAGRRSAWGSVRLNRAGEAEAGRAFVVAARQPGAPVAATHHAALQRMFATGAAPASVPADGGRGLAGWLGAIAADVASRRRRVLARPLPTLAGLLEARPDAAATPIAPGVELWPSSPADPAVGTPGEAVAVTRGVCVAIAVLPSLVAAGGAGGGLAVMFSYRVRMRLLPVAEQAGAARGDALARATLRSRHWATVDADGTPLAPPVDGPGVVGLFPSLAAGGGEWFEYASRTVHPAARVPGAGLPRGAPADRFEGGFEFEGTTVAGGSVVVAAAVPPVELALPAVIY